MRVLAALGVALVLVAAQPAIAEAARTTVASPWGKDDPAGDASRPQGDVRRIVVRNGRQRLQFTFRMAQTPIWDTLTTDRATVMRFFLDFQGTSPAYDRRIAASRADGDSHVVVFNGSGGALCVGDGVMQSLSNHRYRFTVPVGAGTCYSSGAHVLRVKAAFSDDHSDDATDDVTFDKVPNGGGYGPFIRLPN